MPRVNLRENLDTTFTWALCLESGQPPLEIFGGLSLPPREPLNPDWYREERHGEAGYLLNYEAAAVCALSISRTDVAIDLTLGRRPTSRHSGPWMATTARADTGVVVVPVRDRIRATLVALHKAVVGEVLVHLRVVFSRSMPW